MEFLYEYGLFAAKAATLVIAILLAVGGIVGLASKQKQRKGELEIHSISDRIEELKEQANHLLLGKDEVKKLQKEEKKRKKAEKKRRSEQQTQPLCRGF